MPAILNLQARENETFQLYVTWQTLSSGTYVPVDITGYKHSMQVKTVPDSPVALIGLTTVLVASTTTSCLFTDLPATNGTIFINIIDTDLLRLGTGNYYYDLISVSPTFSVKYCLIAGTFTINSAVTLGV